VLGVHEGASDAYQVRSLEASMNYEIRQGDALELLRGLDPGSVDAVITDPPYCAGAISESQRAVADGQGRRSENLKRFGWFVGDNMGTAGLTALLRAVAFEATRAVKPTGSMLIFCDWRMLTTLAPAIESAGVRYQGLVVWDKGSMGLGLGFRNQHELIMHFTFGAPEYHDAGTSNVLRVGRIHASDREHQTEKPPGLLDRLVRVVAPIGGLVVDPFCGSGSTGVAALRLGRRFIGCDRALEHVETARRRIAGPLFAELTT
jgi:site-specific DNA-methyltransferase (adenine-specific)